MSYAQAQVPDGYLDRLLKYIPAEVVAFYVAARGVVPEDAEPEILWIVALAAWVLVPIYFWIATKSDGKGPLMLQVVLGSVAFPVWVFAIGGEPVLSLVWYAEHRYLGSILLIFVTVIFGWIQPPPGS
jgi:hypothetical protein